MHKLLNMKYEDVLNLIKQEKKEDTKKLNLSNYGLREIPKELLELTNLEELDLSSNNLSDISDLSKLISLKKLNLANNEGVSDLKNLSDLKKLINLNLTKSYGINEFSQISKLEKLERVNLSINEIASLKFLHNCNDLKYIDLSNNNIEVLEDLVFFVEKEYRIVIEEDKQNENLKQINIFGNPISKIFEVDIFRESRYLLTYLNKLKNKNPIGHFSFYTTDKNVWEYYENTKQKIDCKESLKLIDLSEIDDTFFYWENIFDNKNIFLNSTDFEGICEYLTIELPSDWVKVANEIKKIDKPYIHKGRYNKIWDNLNLRQSQKAKQALLYVLNRIGLIIWNEDFENIILNVVGFINLLKRFQVLKNKIINQQKLYYDEIHEVAEDIDNQIDDAESGEKLFKCTPILKDILRFAELKKICFKKEDSEYVFVQLLPEIKINWTLKKTLAIAIDYDNSAYEIVYNIADKNKNWIKKGQDNYGKNGFVFEDEGNEIFLINRIADNRIILTCNSVTNSLSVDFINRIIKDVEKIYPNSIKKIKAICYCEKCREKISDFKRDDFFDNITTIDYKLLKRWKDTNEPVEIRCNYGQINLSINKLLGYEQIRLDDMDESNFIRTKKKKVFISYSTEDSNFAKYFKILLSKPIYNLSVFMAEQDIIVGSKWDEVIKTELDEADIVIFLISGNTLASQYINDVEIIKAFDRHKRNEVVIIPIILKECDWQDSEFNGIQVVPSKGAVLKPEYLLQYDNMKDTAWSPILKKIKIHF